MRTNPFSDSLQYIASLHTWTTVVFDVLLLSGIAVGALVWRRRSEQRTWRGLWIYLARLIIGSMWWQQVIWKVPPNFGGLRFWMNEMFKYSAFDLQRSFVQKVVLAHFSFFAPQVFLVEVLIAASLLIGLWTRLGSLLGFLMGINLAFGLYRSPSEWPWTYVFLVVLMGLFAAEPPGRALGLDALLCRPGQQKRWWQRL